MANWRETNNASMAAASQSSGKFVPVHELKEQYVESIATAMVSHQSRAAAAGLTFRRQQSLAEMLEIVETWLHDAREYGVAMNKGAPRLSIKYFWGRLVMNQLLHAEQNDLRTPAVRYERLVAAVTYRFRQTLPINSADHYSYAYLCDCKTHKEYPEGAVRRLYEAKILNDSSSMGLVIHGTGREPPKSSLVSALMHEYRDYHAESGSVLVLTYPTSHLVVDKKQPFPGQCQHLLRSLCEQLLWQTRFAAGLQLGLVTPTFLTTITYPDSSAIPALCTVFRDIILNIAVLVKQHSQPPQTISVIIDQLDQVEGYLDYGNIIQFFRKLCDELVYGQLDRFVHFTYILLHSQIAQIATDPHPNERQIFWDEVERLCSRDLQIETLETIVDCANAPPRATLAADLDIAPAAGSSELQSSEPPPRLVVNGSYLSYTQQGASGWKGKGKGIDR